MLLPETINTDNNFLLFSVKDRGPLGDRLLLGEALVPLSDISQCDQDCVLTDLDQIRLPLTRPGVNVVDILTVIETRRYATVSGKTENAFLCKVYVIISTLFFSLSRSNLNKESRRWLINQRQKLLI